MRLPNYKVEDDLLQRTGIFQSCCSRRSRIAWTSIHGCGELFKAFNEAKAIASAKYNRASFRFANDAWEEQERVLGLDPWEITDSLEKPQDP